MSEFGLKENEIASFVDTNEWLKYFPMNSIKHLKQFGLSVDWRRSFITTNVNEYYSSFIEWQFNKLKNKNRIKYGTRPTIFSPKEGQACADHERSQGETINPQCYTLIKMELLQYETPFIQKNGDKLNGLCIPLISNHLSEIILALHK